MIIQCFQYKHFPLEARTISQDLGAGFAAVVLQHCTTMISSALAFSQAALHTESVSQDRPWTILKDKAGATLPATTPLTAQLTRLLHLVLGALRGWQAGAGPFAASCDGFSRSAGVKLQLALES